MMLGSQEADRFNFPFLKRYILGRRKKSNVFSKIPAHFSISFFPLGEMFFTEKLVFFSDENYFLPIGQMNSATHSS